MILDVKKLGSEVLREVAQPIAAITEEVRSLSAHMIETMYAENGIGLAAPQVGHSLRMFTIDVRIEDEEVFASPGEAHLISRMPLTLINPEIVEFSKDEEHFIEGCLSLPEINADVVRPVSIRLKAQILDGEMIDIECGGLMARCAQHEIDHLDGVLFSDHISDEDKKRLSKKLEKLTMKTLKRESRKRK
jgi:peptide deformylase